MSRPQIDASKVSMVTVDDGNDGQRIHNLLIYSHKSAPKTLVYHIIRKESCEQIKAG